MRVLCMASRSCLEGAWETRKNVWRFGVRSSEFGGVWRGRVALPRDLRGTSIKREHALLHVLWTCYAGRARSESTVGGAAPCVTIKRTAEDAVGWRPQRCPH